MKLHEFILNFVQPNTLIRLWHKVDSNYKEVIEGDKPMMEHQAVKSEYQDAIVLGVTDILYLHSNYIEAVNIVIEK